MTDNKKMWAWIGAAIIVCAIVLVFAWKPNMNGGRGPVATTTPPGTPVFAPSGQLTPQFPTQLILDSAAAIAQSYSINYSTTTNQYSAEYNSSSSMATMYGKYKTYLPANGWTITNDIAKYSDARGLYAENASSVVEVSVVQIGTNSKVNITYLLK